MIYAQVLNGIVQNTIVLEDDSLIGEFSLGFDNLVDITSLAPSPGVGWSYDGTNFSPPAPIALTDQQKINMSISFARQLQIQFSLFNTQRGLSPDQKSSLAVSLAPIVTVMNLGDLTTALALIQQIVPDGVLLTTDILSNFEQQIQGFIASLG